ncbi:serine/threonine-protein kinase-like protein [Strigomonas culicis]|nr:serine/threonine-protein kinase-like protein [Strigomonas culicis]|eukprot:EPY23861.1 serine/threonine-protein kinase-like protein [Strigomonas culicis]
MIEREALIGRIVDHPHIVQSYPPFMTRTDLFLVQKAYGGGELYEALESYSRSAAVGRGGASGEGPLGLPVTIVKRLARELAEALQYLHEKCGVAHRNIKLENIALDDENSVRLGGLGMCAVLPTSRATPAVRDGDAMNGTGADDSELHLCCGSKHYVAPEIVQGVGYDGASVDVWAAGVVLFALLTGSFPFDSETSEEEIFHRIKNADKFLEENPLFQSMDDPQAKDLLRNMLRGNAKARFSLSEVLEHPYLKNVK